MYWKKQIQRCKEPSRGGAMQISLNDHRCKGLWSIPWAESNRFLGSQNPLWSSSQRRNDLRYDFVTVLGLLSAPSSPPSSPYLPGWTRICQGEIRGDPPSQECWLYKIHRPCTKCLSQIRIWGPTFSFPITFALFDWLMIGREMNSNWYDLWNVEAKGCFGYSFVERWRRWARLSLTMWAWPRSP